MHDRELLDFAAKAVGLECKNISWNPLKNDGDAFRLAVQLRIDVAHNPISEKTLWVSSLVHPSSKLGGITYKRSIDDEEDRASATRYVITNSAACVGMGWKIVTP